MPGRSISIFLVDGTASGLRTAELGLSTIKAVVVPRASLSAATQRNELRRTGVYILIGVDSENPGTKKIYVGEADTILTRLTAHNKDQEKDFWDEAVVFVCKDENLTKSHARFLEARLISLALKGSVQRWSMVHVPRSKECSPKLTRLKWRSSLCKLAYFLVRSATTSLNPLPHSSLHLRRELLRR